MQGADPDIQFMEVAKGQGVGRTVCGGGWLVSNNRPSSIYGSTEGEGLAHGIKQLKYHCECD